jgi:hypothetical protein
MSDNDKDTGKLTFSVLHTFFIFNTAKGKTETIYLCVRSFNIVSKYTNWFGIIQCTGFFFAPIIGFAMDWRLKKTGNEKTDHGFVAGYLLTTFVALMLNILVLIPSLSMQVSELWTSRD